jgi:predicted Rdx family selenoprotein
VSLQKAIGEKLGVKSKISLGSPGGFVVVVNGQNVFDYKKEGAMPPMNDLLQRIAVNGRAG